MSFLKTSPRAPEVRFWAERSPTVYWRNLAFVALLMSPFALFAPDSFILGTLVGVAMTAANMRSFRFELTERELRLKPAALVPTLRLPLAEVAEARATGPAAAAGRPVGTLFLKLANGLQLKVTGLYEAAEAAEAVRVLKSRLAGAPTPSASPWAGKTAA